jgi:hypothetical protein
MVVHEEMTDEEGKEAVELAGKLARKQARKQAREQAREQAELERQAAADADADAAARAARRAADETVAALKQRLAEAERARDGLNGRSSDDSSAGSADKETTTRLLRSGRQPHAALSISARELRKSCLLKMTSLKRPPKRTLRVDSFSIQSAHEWRKAGTVCRRKPASSFCERLNASSALLSCGVPALPSWPAFICARVNGRRPHALSNASASSPSPRSRQLRSIACARDARAEWAHAVACECAHDRASAPAAGGARPARGSERRAMRRRARALTSYAKMDKSGCQMSSESESTSFLMRS